MKNKKGQTIYTEEIYFPCEFRTRIATIQLWPAWMSEQVHLWSFHECIKVGLKCRMPSILTGWVQDEVHLQWGHQSLN